MAGLEINGQTDYSLNPQVAVAGQTVLSHPTQVVSYPASAAIMPGQLLEVVSGKVRPAQAGTGALKPIVGVAKFKDTHVVPPFGSSADADVYQIGEMVPVVRKGRVWSLWSAGGVTQGELVALAYVHSSDGSHEQGYFTDHAQVTTTGQEVDACPQGILSVQATGSTTLCLVELNLPA